MDGQLRLKKARVLVVGAGGLGSPVIQYLAAAGVGTIGIVDFDTVDLSNLQRQVIYNTDDVSASKVERAVARARSLNPEIGVNAHDLRLSADNVLALIGDYDLVVDGTDNFSTRYLVNDACVLAGKPNVHAAIYRFEGQVSVFSFGDGPCYRCIFPDPPPPEMVPNCAEGGVLGVIAGVVGALQATEAIKIILESGAPLAGKLLIYDALAASFQTINLRKSPGCPVCGPDARISSPQEGFVGCESVWSGSSISAVCLKGYFQAGKQIVVVDVRTVEEVALGRIEGAKHIPLGDLQDRAGELSRDADIVVYCKSGVRSASAASTLVSLGFTRVFSLEGGILAWARDVDSQMTDY